MASASVCLSLANDIRDADRDAVLARIDAYTATGMAPAQAQRLAARDTAAEIEADHDELMALAREQAGPDDEPTADEPEAEPEKPNEFFSEPGTVEPVQFSKDDPRRRQDSTRATIAAGRIRASLDQVAEWAQSMDRWRDWYEVHEDAIKEHFGPDADLFLRLLSVTSQASTVASNFTQALKAYRQWYDMAPFEGFLPAVEKNLTRLRNGEPITGPKITGYSEAVLGDAGGIAVDRHIARLLFGVDKPNRKQIAAARDRIVAVAERLGWTPREAQSALWAYNQFREGKAPEEVTSYASIIATRPRRVASSVRYADDAVRKAGGIRTWKDALERTLGGRGQASQLLGRAGVGHAADVAPTIQYAKDTAGTQAAIASLPPGHYVKWDNGKGKTFVYKGAQPVPGASGKKVTDAVTAFHALANKAKKAAAQAQPAASNDSAKNTLKDMLATLPTPMFDVVKEHLSDMGIGGYNFWLGPEWVDTLTPAQVKGALTAVENAQNDVPTKAAVAKVAASPLAKLKPQWDAPTTWEFVQWFGKSVAVLANGKPKVFLHGTARIFNAFKPKQAGSIFASSNVTFAEWFAVVVSKGHMDTYGHTYDPRTVGQNIMPLWIKAENPWDYDNPEHVKALIAKWNEIREGYGMSPVPWDYPARVAKGDWQAIEENTPTAAGERYFGVEAIQALGFDSFHMAEKGEKNIAVFSPEQVKPALGPGTISWDEANAMLQAARTPQYGMKPLPLSSITNVGAYGQRAITDEEAAPYGMSGDQASVAAMGGDLRFSRDPDAALIASKKDPTDPDYPQWARKPNYELSDFGPWGKFIQAIQDRYNRFKQTVTQIAAQGGTVDESNDFYAAEARYWGIVGTGIEDFNAEVKDWIAALTKDGLSLQDVTLYSYALHAPERNASIAAKRPSMPDGGSGMTNERAQEIQDEALHSGLKPVLDKHVAKMHEWIQGTRDLALDQGLIDDTEYLELSGSWPNYVPLRGLPEKFGAKGTKTGTGSGYGSSGSFGKEAMGRYSEAKNIIEQIIQDRSTTLIRAGKAQVGRTFLKFVLDNPAPNLWEVEAVERKPTFKTDEDGNRWIEEQEKVIDDKDRTITVKDGGQDIRILIKDDTLRQQLQNMHVEQLNKFLVPLMVINRTLSKLYTTLSPVFVAINLLRDVQAATVGIVDELGWIGAPKLFAALPGAFAAAARSEFKGVHSPNYQLYRATGGKTAFFTYQTIEEKAAELKALAATADRSKAHPRRVAAAAMDLIEATNGTVENAVRFASFQATLNTVNPKTGKKGTLAEASSVSKNITVNFNRKGTMTPALSAWFLFFNPAVQGTARVMQAMKNPKVQALMSGAVVGTVALAMRNASMGDDDDDVPWWDKIPDEVKERNLIIVLPPGVAGGDEIPETKTGRYVKIPMPYGYNFFAVLGNQIADVWRNSQNPRWGRPMTEAGAKLFQAATGAFIPAPEIGRSFENPKSIALAFAPDAVNPVLQNILNLNTFGRAMRPDDQNVQSKPSSERYFAGQAGSIFQRTARTLNDFAGGNQFMPAEGVPSVLDQAPASLENLVRGYGGGLVQFGLDLTNAMYLRQSLERDDFEAHRLPFAKQVWGVIDNETDRMVSSKRANEIQMRAERMKAAEDAGKVDELREMIDRWGVAPLAVGPLQKEIQKEMSELRKAELVVIESDEPASVKYARMQGFNATRRKLLQTLNSAYDNAVHGPQVSAATATQ